MSELELGQTAHQVDETAAPARTKDRRPPEPPQGANVASGLFQTCRLNRHGTAARMREKASGSGVAGFRPRLPPILFDMRPPTRNARTAASRRAALTAWRCRRPRSACAAPASAPR